jgi:glycosyltransferase involved in cell wall biosynthesis
LAINAIDLWHKDDPRVQLHIVGPVLDETYAEEVRIALGDENINNCCRYYGPLVQEELHAAMGAANVVINTSTSEGM